MEARADAKQFATALDELGPGLVACFTPHDAANFSLLDEHRFRLISVRATLERSVDGLIEPSSITASVGWNMQTRSVAKEMGAEGIRAFAETIGATSRYFKDAQIPAARSLALYEKWINNSLTTGLADEVFLASVDGKPAALHTVKIKDDLGSVDLIGVLPAYQGRGLGAASLWAGINHLKNRGVSKIDVVTEAENVDAVRMYERAGFFLVQVQFVYHRTTGAPITTQSLPIGV